MLYGLGGRSRRPGNQWNEELEAHDDVSLRDHGSFNEIANPAARLATAF
jgi:hypothetical protein